MAYKDKDKQKVANKAASQRRRNKLKGMTPNHTVIPDSHTPNVIPEQVMSKSVQKRLSKMGELPANFGLSNCECKHCQQSRANKSKLIINHGPAKTYDRLMANEVNRVSLPSDVDYVGAADSLKAHEVAP